MALSFVEYDADGTTDNFALTFGYLAKTHVTVVVNGDAVPFTWLTPSMISITGGVVNGDEVRISRTTPKTPLANANDGSVLTNSVLTTLALQNIYLSEESQDIANEANLTTAEAVEIVNDAVEIVGGYQDVVEDFRDEAEGFATAASGSATAASASAAAAATSESNVSANATTIATNAANTAVVAATSTAEAHRDAAAASAAAAASDAASVAAAFDSFDDRYLGPKASDPTLDNDGNALVAGALYYNTTSGVMKSYNGTNWTSIQPGLTQVDGDARYFRALTGDTKTTMRITAEAGWVFMSGKTIGDASSSATERANADCEALFKYLWDNFANSLCPVVGGRGASSSADWSAHKQITLPDASNRVLAGRDYSTTDRLTSAVSGVDGDTLGASGGDQRPQQHTHGTNEAAHSHTGNGPFLTANNGDNVWITVDGGSTYTIYYRGSTQPAATGLSIQNAGSGGSQNVQPTLIVNMLIKL